MGGATLLNPGDLTVSMWVRPLSPCELVALSGVGGARAGLEYYTDGSYHALAYREAGLNAYAPVEAGAWAHIVLAVRGNGRVLYINGKRAIDTSAGNTLAVDGVTIGGGSGAYLFDVRVVRGVVSDASISTYYAAVGRGGEGWLP